MYDFQSDLIASQRSERAFMSYLKGKGMKDVEQAPDEVFHDWDIKTTHDSYEIKRDRWFEKTGNICIETTSNTETNSLGWFHQTKAKWLIVFYNEHQFYGLKMDYLREMWFSYPKIWTMKLIQQDSGYKTICWLAPVSEFVAVMSGDVRK